MSINIETNIRMYCSICQSEVVATKTTNDHTEATEILVAPCLNCTLTRSGIAEAVLTSGECETTETVDAAMVCIVRRFMSDK